MNTKVKVGIAAAIIAALVAIIVVDQRSSKGTQTAQASPSSEPGAAPDQQTGIILNHSESQPATDLRAGVVAKGREELDRTTAGIVKGAQPDASGAGIKGQDLPLATVPEPSPAETYEVQQGDTMYIIAEKKYGDGNLYPLIAKANTKVNPNRLRVGQKLVIPTRGAAPTAPTASDAPVLEEGGQKSYMVQAGDTLGEIAKRVYSTARRSVIDRIIAANPGLDTDGINLRVGMKLSLPSIEVTAAPRVESPVAAAPDHNVSTGKTYKVAANDSLWKIAAKFRNGKSTTEMMEKIVAANGDLLHSTGDALHLDWVLVIPD